MASVGRSGSEYAALVTRGMSERSWSVHVEQLLRLTGWRFFHPWISIRSAAGFPDLLAIRDGRCIVLELKSERGKLTPAQAEWLALFAAVPGCEAYLLRPSDRERLVEILQGPDQ